MSNNENNKKEQVNHPDHYNSGEIETIEAIEDWGFGIGFNAGNAIKYISRHQHKSKPIQDLEKAVWYIQKLIEYYKKREKREKQEAQGISK